MAGRLAGKAAVVTGAASGMGKAIALAYLKEDAQIVAADISVDGLKALEEEVKEAGYADCFRWIKCNITNAEDCKKAVEECVNAYGTCNVLSHNAGIGDDFTPVDELTDEQWDRLININLTGSMKITRAALQYFVPNGIKASIVMITSNAAFESATGGPAYCSSKAGANGLMKAIAFEYGRVGIRCNSICPGPVATNISNGVKRNPRGVEMHLKAGYNAACRAWTCKPLGFPDDIAPLSVYLASDESGFVNSASIIIDAGVCLSS